MTAAAPITNPMNWAGLHVWTGVVVSSTTSVLRRNMLRPPCSLRPPPRKCAGKGYPSAGGDMPRRSAPLEVRRLALVLARGERHHVEVEPEHPRRVAGRGRPVPVAHQV